MQKSAEKSKFSVCRVCLALNMRMHTMGPIVLNIFEKITKTKIHPKDGKPNTVCYICFSLLKRCVLFANMSRITEEILNQILLTNPQITQDLIKQHSEGIVSTYYPIPAVTNSYSSDTYCSESVNTESIVKGCFNVEPTIKTEGIEEDQVIVTITDVFSKEEPDETEDEYILHNEQLLVGDQTTEMEHLEQIVTKIAENIESEQDIDGKISENEGIVKEEKDDSLNTNNMKSDEKGKKKENNNNSENKLNKTEINELIYELAQEVKDEINAIENESLIDIKEEQIDEEHTADFVTILSDDESMAESNDHSFIIQERDDAIIFDDEEHEADEPRKKKSKRTLYVCSSCSKTFGTLTLLKTHMKKAHCTEVVQKKTKKTNMSTIIHKTK